MDEQGFIAFMREEKKSQRAIQAHVARTKAFETYLTRHGKTLETATPEDLQVYALLAHADLSRSVYAGWTTASLAHQVAGKE